MKKSLIFIIGLMLLKAGFAEELAREWSEKLAAQRGILTAKYPQNILFISHLQPSGSSSLIYFNPVEFNRFGFSRIADAESLDWSFKLNEFEKRQPPAKNRFIRTFGMFSKLEKFDTIILAGQSKKWHLITEISRKIFVKKALFRGNPDSLFHIYDWIFSLLNYNGIVLDSDKDSILVESAFSHFSVGDQAVVFSDSSDLYFLSSGEKRKISALVECIDAHFSYGVFKFLISSLPPEKGNKVRILPQITPDRGKESNGPIP